MNEWLRARNGWTLLLFYWGIALTAGLLGTATAMILQHHATTSFASRLPWVMGGSLFIALGGTGGALHRRRRQG